MFKRELKFVRYTIYECIVFTDHLLHLSIAVSFKRICTRKILNVLIFDTVSGGFHDSDYLEGFDKDTLILQRLEGIQRENQFRRFSSPVNATKD